MRKLFITSVAVILTCSLYAQTASFSIISNGTTPTIDSAIAYVTDIWSQHLNSAVPIKIRINYQSLSSAGPLGITFPNGVKNFPGAPVADVWYPYSLANAIIGTELNPGELDMEVFINSFFNMHFSTDGNPPAGSIDFVSLLLHEICHGLGFVSLAKVDGNQGSFGKLTAADFAPISPSFQFPDLEGKPSVYDVYLWQSNTDSLLDTTIFPNPGIALEMAFTGNDIVIRGGDLFSNVTPPKIYAPVSFALGSSISHLDEQTYPAGDSNSLMTPFLSQQEVVHEPGAITIEILQKLGWPEEPTSIHTTENRPGVEVFPNPSRGDFRFYLTHPALVMIIDCFGRVVFHDHYNSGSFSANLQLEAGVYLLNVIQGDRQMFRTKLIIK